MSAAQLQEYFNFAVDLAIEAGERILNDFHSPKEIEYKAAIDLVTKSDKAVEELVMGKIKEKYPDHTFVAEESISAGYFEEKLTDQPTWIIDPIDGTTNFVHKHPFACISIALAINQEIVVGVIHNPMMSETFTAIKGQGSFLNGKKISVTEKDTLKQCLVGTGFPYDRSPDNLKLVLDQMGRVLTEVRDLRRAGSAALDMAYVACGILDIYYERGVHAWDIAAGCLLVTEAGGVVSGFDGKFPIDICNRQVVATNSKLLPKIVSLITKH